MSKQASFKVYLNDEDGKQVWQIHYGYIAPDFVQGYIIGSDNDDDIGAGFSAEMGALCGKLADMIEAHMKLI